MFDKFCSHKHFDVFPGTTSQTAPDAWHVYGDIAQACCKTTQFLQTQAQGAVLQRAWVGSRHQPLLGQHVDNGCLLVYLARQNVAKTKSLTIPVPREILFLRQRPTISERDHEPLTEVAVKPRPSGLGISGNNNFETRYAISV